MPAMPRQRRVEYAGARYHKGVKTKDKAEATRLLLAMNEAGKQPAMNLSLARVYLKHSDPMGRDWVYGGWQVEGIGDGEDRFNAYSVGGILIDDPV